MYGYIYDVFLHQKPYEKELIRLDHALTDKDLKGPVVKLTLINNIAHAVEELLRRGMKTLVAVGSDQLFSKLADQVAEHPHITLGLIPFGSHQRIAGLFGIPEGAKAADVLSARLVRSVALAKINNAYFIHDVQIHDKRANVSLNGEFTLSATAEQAHISIFNRTLIDAHDRMDRRFSVHIVPATEKKLFRKAVTFPETNVVASEIKIGGPNGIPLIVDGQKIINTPAVLEMTGKRLQIIMGKDRALF